MTTLNFDNLELFFDDGGTSMEQLCKQIYTVTGQPMFIVDGLYIHLLDKKSQIPERVVEESSSDDGTEKTYRDSTETVEQGTLYAVYGQKAVDFFDNNTGKIILLPLRVDQEE